MVPNALDLVEAAWELYRRSFRDELWRYYAASAPFAIAVGWGWERAVSRALPQVWGLALLWTLAYAVRILGTGAYSRRLLRSCGGEAAPSHLREKLGELWAHAALLSLWWLGLLAVAGTGVFYTAAQYTAFDGRGGVRAVLRQARRWWRQQWVLLGLALLFGAILLVNLGLTALILPSLLHSLLGVAGVIGRSGTAQFLFGSSLFWVCLLLAVYLALDPLLKCAMAVSYQRLGAARSGADLASAMRELERAPAIAGRGQVFAVALAPGVAPAALSRAIKAELRQPQYAWHSGQTPRFATELGHFLAWVLHPFARVGRWLAGAVRQVWQWIERWIFGSPSVAAGHGAAGHGWERAAWALTAVCLLMIAALLAKRSRRKRPTEAAARVEAMPLDVATASAEERESEAWFALAQTLLGGGEPRLAFRAAFLGGLAGLGQRRLLTIRRDRTNREYCEEFARLAPLLRSTASPERFRDVVRAFDEVWYGGRGVDAARVQQYLAAQRELLSHA